MATHRWASPTPLLRGDEDVHPDEEFEPTEAELKHFGDQIVEIESASENSDDDLDERALEATEENYQTVVSAVEDGQCDEFLDDLKEADDRSSVQDAITDRRGELRD